MKENQLNPSEIIYVGDQVRDISACRKINCKIIAVSWGYNSKSRLIKGNPDFLVDKPKDILQIVKKLKNL